MDIPKDRKISKQKAEVFSLLLGSDKPMYGYEIKKLAKIKISLRSVYKYLSELGKMNQIVKIEIKAYAGDKPNRKSYQLTPLGKEIIEEVIDNYHADVFAKNGEG